MLNNGDILDGRYRIVSKIGQGGMATVYRARDLKLERDVAVKLLKSEYSKDAEFIERFKNEARSAAKLSHSNIVAAYDIVNSNDRHYIVMELVEGITLRDYIARKGRLSNKETIGIALQTAEGLGEAHRNGIIHRDIKSQNIIISKEGRIKIGDFGIAKAASTDSAGQPVIGSAHYIAPEQAANGEADARSDLYSLGISMYEMITGRLPYQGEDAQNVIMAHLQDALVPPVVYNSGIYPALNDIIIKATKKAPEDRYQSAEELIEDLKHAAAEPDGHFVRLYDSVASGSLKSGQSGSTEDKNAAEYSAGAAGAGDKVSSGSSGANIDGVLRDEASAAAAHAQHVQPSSAKGNEYRADNMAGSASGASGISGSDDNAASARGAGADGAAGGGGPQAAPAEDFLDGSDDDYTVKRHAHRGSRGGLLESYEDSKTKLLIAGVTAAVVVLAVIIGIFVLKSGHTAHDAAESKLAESESETGESSSESAETGMDYTLSIQGEDVMPDLIGMTVDEARAQLASIRMSMDSSTTDYSDTYPKGTVMKQSPAANDVLTADTTVYVTVSLGTKDDYVLDNLKNMTEEEAVKAVEDAGMAVSDEVDRDFSEEVAEDRVAGCSDDGKTDDGKRRIKLILSYGKKDDYVVMPDICNTSVIDAEQQLKNNNLSLGRITAVNSADGVPTDVLTQSVEADKYVKKGSSIDVTVCVGSDYSISDGSTFEDASEAVSTINDSDDTLLGSASGTVTSKATEGYYGSIDTTCVVGDASGPGASGTIMVAVRLAQRVDGSMEYTSLSEPIPVAPGTKIPVSYRNIKGAYGVSEGTVEVYGADNGIIYSSYVIKFSNR